MTIEIGSLVRLSSRPGREHMVLRLKENQQIEVRQWPLHSAPLSSFDTSLSDVTSVRGASEKEGL